MSTTTYRPTGYRRTSQRIGDHICPTCGGPGRFYRIGRHGRYQTLCFSCRTHGTLLTAIPLRPGAPHAA
jgi:phage/plasmid primase-like uncharacterized protein